MSMELFNKFRYELKGKQENSDTLAAQLTFATIAEAGALAAMKGYYGQQELMQSRDHAEKQYAAMSDTEAEQMLINLSDDMLEDFGATANAYLTAHTTSDFPLVVKDIQNRTLRDPRRGVESMWRMWIRNITTTNNFKPIRSLRLTELPELLIRPEGTDVKYASFSESEEGYRVANYERGLKYTWEMWLNDEIGAFSRALESLGRGAMRTEAMVIFTALLAGVARSVETGITAGVPTPARLEAAQIALATRTFTDSDGNSVEYGYNADAIVHGTRQRSQVYRTINQEFLDFDRGEPNPVYQGFTPYLETLWGRVFGDDWLVWDSHYDFMEVAFLEGYQGGARTFTKVPTTQGAPNRGSFEDSSLSVKVSHVVGAKVIDATAILRNEG